MTITSALVLFAVIWFMVLFVVLPLRLTTQAEAGRVEPGTPESAPVDPKIGAKVKIVTAVTVLLWLVVAGVILSGWITVDSFDISGWLGAPQ
jgi:predicted secreted protein